MQAGVSAARITVQVTIDEFPQASSVESLSSQNAVSRTRRRRLRDR